MGFFPSEILLTEHIIRFFQFKVGQPISQLIQPVLKALAVLRQIFINVNVQEEIIGFRRPAPSLFLLTGRLVDYAQAERRFKDVGL